MVLWYMLFAFIFIGCVYLFFTRKYCNPYTLTMVFGKKGCGKTTYLTKLAYNHWRDGWLVFSTENIEHTIHIDYSDIGRYWFPEHSVILVDEVGMIWDSRDFKNFKNEVRDWFKYQRHNKVKVYLFSQTFDIDKKLRDLTDQMYLLVKLFRVFSYGKKIDKHIVLNNSTAEAPSTIAENLKFEPFIFFFLGTRTLTYIPHWSKGFDSHSRLPIPDLPLSRCESWTPYTKPKKQIHFSKHRPKVKCEPT